MKKYLLPLFLTSFSLYADEPVKTAKGGNFSQTLIILAVALFFFYFILLRPEQKRRKKANAMRNALKKGDKVTAMGMIGTVEKVTDTTVILKSYDGAKIEMLKASITDVQPSAEVENAPQTGQQS